MTNKVFYDLMEKTFRDAMVIAHAKGADYTKGSLDALANFKEGGKALGIPPEKVCWVFMNKHYQAITNYVRTGGRSESEPIEERIKDMINYLVLLQAIITEQTELINASEGDKKMPYHADNDPFLRATDIDRPKEPLIKPDFE